MQILKGKLQILCIFKITEQRVPLSMTEWSCATALGWIPSQKTLRKGLSKALLV